jgi:CHAD domain-containing protein
MGKTRKKDLCQEIQKCCRKLAADLNRDRRAATTPVEMIHRLRVSSRQGAALLRWCKKQNGTLDRLKKVLRRIRERAGPLRDADIVLMQLQSLMPQQPTRPWWVLWGMAIQWHAEVAAKWRDTHEKLYEDAMAVKEIVDEECTRRKFATLGNKRCSTKLQNRYDQWKDAFDQAKRSELLHRLRIAGKHLRYALETYPDPRVENKRQWTPWLKDIQDALGQLRDRQLLQTWMLDAEKLSVHDIVTMPDWLRFLHSCQKTLSKQIRKDQNTIQRSLRKPPEWADLK